MDFRLSDEERMIRETVRDFIRREVMPLEPEVLENERQGRQSLPRETVQALQHKARALGFWGINTPEEYGGANLGSLAAAVSYEELGRTFVPFHFGGSADNILYHGNAAQRERYLTVPSKGGIDGKVTPVRHEATPESLLSASGQEKVGAHDCAPIL